MATAAVTYTFTANTLIQSAQANTNFQDLVTFLNNSVIHKDGSIAFTAIPSGPATDPSGDNQFARKAYVDKLGIVARQSLTASSAGWTSTSATDMTLVNVPVTAGRVYGIHLHTQASLSASANWSAVCYLNGAQIGKFKHVDEAGTSTIDGMVYWLPSVTASTDDILVQVTEDSGTATLQFQASATDPRTLSLIDFGAL